MNFDPTPFQFAEALANWAIVFGIFLGIFLLLLVVVAVGRAGAGAPMFFAETILDGVRDTIGMSFRRLWALSLLTFRESIRRKVLLVFIVFAVLFMFAGWFVTDVNTRPDLQVKVSVETVLRIISFMVLSVMLLVACWGLPADIQSRSLHTIVTKPARRNEIILGRMFGYTMVGTMILTIMGAIGYIWITRQVSDEARERLVSRVPIYGQLTFLDREGNLSYKKDRDGNFILDEEGKKIPYGINVGDPWEHRSYITGATKARAVWNFDDIAQDDLGEEFRLESRFEAFRTHKGADATGRIKRLLVQYTIVNEDKGMELSLPAFEVLEYTENITRVKRDSERKTKVEGAPTVRVDTEDRNLYHVEPELYDQIVSKDDTVRIEVGCLNAGQYIGMARPDLFIRTPDRSFFSGYSKALFGVWLMMVVVIAIATNVSCFVKGPVATLLTLVVVLVGLLFHGFMGRLVEGEVEGSGTIESMVRLVEHKNPQVDLADTTSTRVVQTTDKGFRGYLWIWHKIIPDFQIFTMKAYPANGFDVPWNAAILPSMMITLAYIIPCLVVGYFSLKLRELEAK